MASELQGAGEIEHRHEMAKTGNTAHEDTHTNVLAQHATIRQRRRPRISSRGRGGRGLAPIGPVGPLSVCTSSQVLARNLRRERKLDATLQGFRKSPPATGSPLLQWPIAARAQQALRLSRPGTWLVVRQGRSDRGGSGVAADIAKKENGVSSLEAVTDSRLRS